MRLIASQAAYGLEQMASCSRDLSGTGVTYPPRPGSKGGRRNDKDGYPGTRSRDLREHGMRTSAETLKYGLAQNKFPFGEAVVSPQGTYTFYIYERLFMQWIQEREEAQVPI